MGGTTARNTTALLAIHFLLVSVASSAVTHANPERALVLSAPPHLSPQESAAIYGAIADYLSGETGKRIVYHYPGSWGAYRSEMLRDAYDLVFDGPHFNAYRREKLGHETLVRFPGRMQFAIIARQDLVFKTIYKMYGRTFCTLPPPNLGTQVLWSLFDNPARQPVVIPLPDWNAVYDGVVAGRCTAGVLPLAVFATREPGNLTRVLYHSAQLPAQALSAGKRVPMRERRRIVQALTAAGAGEITEPLARAWRASGRLVPAKDDEYDGMDIYLRNEWGFD